MREEDDEFHLGPVHKLLGVVVVDPVYLQKRVRLAEEILQRGHDIQTSDPVTPDV